MGRIFIFGIDSGTFSIILPLVEAGKMPTVAGLMRNGSWGTLRSTFPPLTPPAWTSFMTGRNPENHGVFDFSRNGEMIGPKYKTKIVTSANIRCHTIFDIFGLYEKISLIVGLPMTYPPFPVHGALISGFMTPGTHAAFTYPPALKEELLTRLGGYAIDVDPHAFAEFNEQEYMRERAACDESKIAAVRYLFEKHADWTVAVVVFSSIDHIQHYFWKYSDPRHSDYHSEKAKLYRHTVEDFYIQYDKYLERLLEHTTDRDTVFIVSDHGAASVGTAFHVNVWLEQNGYLKRNLRIEAKKAMLSLAGKARAIFGDGGRPGSRKNPIVARIDFGRTLAFGGLQAESGIYLNVKGKRPRGRVRPGGACESLRNELISRLRTVREPQTGKLVFAWVKPREEVYSGGLSENTPEILFESTPNFTVFPGLRDTVFDYNPEICGKHDENGIFVARGPAVKKGCRIASAHIADIAPTTLYLLGLPVDSEMNGKIIEEIIDDGYRESHPPETKKYSDVLHGGERGGGFTEDEEEAVRKKLEELGYM